MEKNKKNLLIVIDYFKELRESYSKIFPNREYEEYFDFKKKNIDKIINFSINDNNFLVFNAFYLDLLVKNQNRNKYTSVLSKKQCDFDFSTKSTEYDYSFIEGFNNIYICGAALAQCVMQRTYGYPKIHKNNKYLLMDAIFTIKLINNYDIKKWKKYRLYTTNSITDIINFEDKYIDRNLFNKLSVNDLIK